MRRLVFLLLIVAGVAGGGWTAWRYVSQPLVQVGRPTRGPAVAAVYATGVVEPITWAKVTPKVAGRLVELCHCEGQDVKSGDVLARLDDAAERARVNELEARTAFLAKEVERYGRLAEGRVASPQTLERVTSAYSEAVAAVAVARERLAELTLRSPLDGVVLRRDGEVGEVVVPGTVVFWVGQPKPLWIVSEVDEEDIPRVAVGQRALIKADAFPGRTLDGAVGRITPMGDPVNKRFRVYVNIPDDTPLLIGMTTEINIVVATVDDALLVPAEALSQGRVFVIEGGRAAARPVQTGIVGDRLVEIQQGLAPDARIVLAPPTGLADGTLVRVRDVAEAGR